MTSRDTDPNKRAAMLEDLIRSAKTLSQPYYGTSFGMAS
jgi:hypothetical protein